MKEPDRLETSLTGDSNLTGTDVKYWLRNDSYLSPAKFFYVDLFVKTIQIEEEYEWIVSRVIESKERAHKAIFNELYQSRSGEQSSLLDIPSPALLISPPLKSRTKLRNDPSNHVYRKVLTPKTVEIGVVRQILLYIRNIEKNVPSVTVLYLSAPLSEENSVPPDGSWAAAFGYLVPLGTRPKPTLAILKTFRLEAASKTAGSGYSSSKAYIHFLGEDFGGSLRAIRIGWDDHIAQVSPLIMEQWKEPDIDFEEEHTKMLNNILRLNIEVSPSNDIMEFLYNLTNRYLLW